MQDKKLPLPPYGKVLQAYQDENIYLIPHIDIYIGKYAKETAFYYKRQGQLCCYLPYGDSYLNYRWPIIGQRVIIIDTGFSVINLIDKMVLFLFEQYKPDVITFCSNLTKPDELVILSKSNLSI